jgi:hypothetical protein
MSDRVTISVRDLKRSKNFNDQVLKPLGKERLYNSDGPFAAHGRGAFLDRRGGCRIPA